MLFKGEINKDKFNTDQKLQKNQKIFENVNLFY